jgi:hypothetical protein
MKKWQAAKSKLKNSRRFLWHDVGFHVQIKNMKCWAVLTVLLYALALLLLTVPAVLIAFGNWGKHDYDSGFSAAFGIYSQWGYWLWLAVLVAGQILLLLVPIDISERRLPARRKLKIPVIVTTFFLANLFIAGLFSIICAIFTDNSYYTFSFVDWLLGHKTSNAGQPQTVDVTGWGFVASALIVIGIFWLVWAIIFKSYSKSDEPDALIKRAVRWLLRGSILELLVAVPSHVIVRRRDDCCAPAGTFWGIATGISVMLLCFGPGVYFLFVERFQKLKPKSKEADTKYEAYQ